MKAVPDPPHDPAAVTYTDRKLSPVFHNDMILSQFPYPVKIDQIRFVNP